MAKFLNKKTTISKELVGKIVQPSWKCKSKSGGSILYLLNEQMLNAIMNPGAAKIALVALCFGAAPLRGSLEISITGEKNVHTY
jgi:hypothetical protein